MSKKGGWYGESNRHSMAARGIRSSWKSKYKSPNPKYLDKRTPIIPAITESDLLSRASDVLDTRGSNLLAEDIARIKDQTENNLNKDRRIEIKNDYQLLCEAQLILAEQGYELDADEIQKDLIDYYPYELYEDHWGKRPKKISDLVPEHREGVHDFLNANYTKYELEKMSDQKAMDIAMENMAEWWHRA